MKSIIGKELVRAQARGILSDESCYSEGVPERVYYPETEEELITSVCEARRLGVPITVIGGQTGITGGSVPVEGCIAVCMDRINRIMRVDTDACECPVLYCQPGVTIAQIEDFLSDPASYASEVPGMDRISQRSWFYPPDPTEMTAQLGGTVATNASGARSFMFGATRSHVAALSIVFADGDTATLQRGRYRFGQGGCSFLTDMGGKIELPLMRYTSPKIKNSAGYYSFPGMDLVDLFVGSEGTLGIFSEIGVTLSPSQSFIAGLSFFKSVDAALDFATFLRGAEDTASIEYFDGTALKIIAENREHLPFKFSDFPSGSSAAIYWEICENRNRPFEKRMEELEIELERLGSSLDSTWSGIDNKDNARLKAFRHAVPESINLTVSRNRQKCGEIRKISSDTAVPPECFAEFFDACKQLISDTGLNSVYFGHIGDCHLHINLLPSDAAELERSLEAYDDIMEKTVSLGGTVSAEHGIGKLKSRHLLKMYGKEAVAGMVGMKKALDPDGRLNPGNLFGDYSISSIVSGRSSSD